MKNLLKIDPRLQIALILGIIWLVYLLFNFSVAAFIFPLLSVVLAVGFDLAITYFRRGQFYFSPASIVTGLLIGLIIYPEEHFLAFVSACLIAVLSKQFLKTGERQHIFNPAAFGIMVTSLVFGITVSWWAVSWNQLVIFLIICVSYTLYKLKRLWLPITFFVSYFIYLLLVFEPKIALKLLFDGSPFLFAFVMLPEPMTSPGKGYLKFLWGPLNVLLIFILSKFTTLSEVFLPALLISNTVRFGLARIRSFTIPNPS